MYSCVLVFVGMMGMYRYVPVPECAGICRNVLVCTGMCQHECAAVCGGMYRIVAACRGMRSWYVMVLAGICWYLQFVM